MWRRALCVWSPDLLESVPRSHRRPVFLKMVKKPCPNGLLQTLPANVFVRDVNKALCAWRITLVSRAKASRACSIETQTECVTCLPVGTLQATCSWGRCVPRIPEACSGSRKEVQRRGHRTLGPIRAGAGNRRGVRSKTCYCRGCTGSLRAHVWFCAPLRISSLNEAPSLQKATGLDLPHVSAVAEGTRQ